MISINSNGSMLSGEILRKLIEESDCSADLDEGVGCRAGSTAFWLTWDGRMLPCGMMPCPTAYPLEIVQSEDELLEAVLNEYAVTEETAKKDLRAFLDKLRDMGIL